MPVEVSGLSFAYGDKPVLGCARATYDEGMVHLILGRTGSGKTTFALMLAGLIEPQAGSIRVDGSDPAGRGFDRSVVQLAFQFPEAQIFEVSVEKEILYGLRNLGLGEILSRQRCLEALELVGLSDDLLHRDPASLSFGERRKVALASVIALKPRYLILDEPLAGLDWKGRKSLVKAINGLRGEGLAIMILTHEADLLAETGDTVSVIAGARLSGPAPVSDFLASVKVRDREMLPDHLLVLLKLADRGIKTGGRPRTVGEVCAAVAGALGFE